MADNDTDFDDILEGTVDEVTDAIDELDDADYDGLLEAEENGKDRKTVKEHIESLIDDEEEDEDPLDEVDESAEEVVEEIEEETEGGVLGSFSRTSVLGGGLILGIILGFAVASFSGPAGANPDQVKENVRTIAAPGDFNGTVEVTDPVRRNSMYYMNVTMSQDTVNGTAEQTQGVYVTLDGQKLFVEQVQLGRTLSPVDIPSTLEQIEAQQNQNTQQPQTAPETNATQ